MGTWVHRYRLRTGTWEYEGVHGYSGVQGCMGTRVHMGAGVQGYRDTQEYMGTAVQQLKGARFCVASELHASPMPLSGPVTERFVKPSGPREHTTPTASAGT